MRYRELINIVSRTSPDVTEGHNLNELAGVKRFKDMTAADVLQYFKQRMGDGPVKLLGNGMHGAAFMVGNNVYKMWLQDSAYQAFVNYALQHQDNPFLPRFFSGIKQMPAFFVRGRAAPDYVNYIKMEKLSGTADDIKRYNFNLNCNIVNDTDSDTRKEFLTKLSWYDATQLLQRPMCNDMKTFLQYLRLDKENAYTYTEDDLSPELRLFIETIRNIMRLNRDLDLFADNFMLRGNQLVIVDPLYDNDDYQANQDFVFRVEQNYNKPAVTSNHVRKSKPEPDEPDESDDDWGY